MDVEWRDTADFPIGERDTKVLHVIGEEGLTDFTFDGLKRRLGVHQETLSRILNRLEERGIVEKGFGGYEVTSKGKELLSLRSLGSRQPRVPLIQTLLPRDFSVERIVPYLKGKWFGTLRWLGSSENEEGVTLKWVTEDGEIQVSANFSSLGLTIEATLLRKSDLNAALKASYELMGYISKLFSRRSPVRLVAYFAFDPYFMPA